MNTYKIEKKRDGQGWKDDGEIYAANPEEAKKKFADVCWNDLLSGVHGDNFIYLNEEIDSHYDFFEENGIYYDRELFMPESDLEDGIESFSEDVYTWRLLA